MKKLFGCFLQCLCVGLLTISSVQALVFVESYSQNLSGATRVVLDADGNYAYACAFNAQTLNVFSRNANNGKLTFVETHKQAVNNVAGLQGALNLTLSPDGKHVYVAAFSENALGIFSRNAANGRLTFVQALVSNGNNGLTRPNNLAFDDQSQHLYVTSNDGVAVFSRDANTGLLTFVARYSNGVNASGITGATAVRVSHDGQSVYVAGRTDNSVAFFQRDANSGELKFFSHAPNGLNGVMGLGGAYDVQITPDDSLLLVSGNTDAAIAVFARQSDGRLAYKRMYQNGSDGIDGLLGVQSLQLSQDGSRLFAVGNSANALAMFEVLDGSTTGAYLNFVKVIKEGAGGISTLSGISSAAVGTAVRHVYTTALNDNNISLFSLDSADLRLSMTAPTSAQTEGTFAYSLGVENLGPSAATAVTLTDTLPSQVSYNMLGSDSRCSEVAGVVTCQLGTVSAGQSVNVVVSVTANTTGTATNKVSVSSGEPDGDLTNNSVQASTQVINQQLTTDLAVNLFVDTNPVNINRNFIYRVQVNTAGPSDATNVVVTFTQPTGTSFVSSQTTAGTCSNTGNQVRCTLSTLKLNNTQLISITLLSPSQAADMTANVSVTSSETDLQSSDNSAQLSSRVEVISTNLELVTPITNPTSITLGQVLTYEAKMRNLAATAATDVVLEATLKPADSVRFVSGWTGNPNVSDGFKACSDQGQGVVRCALGTVDAMANPVSVQIAVLPVAAGTLSANFALSSSATDTDASNNQASAENVVISGDAIDLALTIPSATPSPAFIGNPLEYTFTISNSHTTASAKNVSLAISLPATVDYIGASASQGSGCSETASTVNCTLGNIAAASSVSLIVTLRPTSDDTVQVSAQLGSDTFDPNSNNDSASRSVNVQTATADLELQASATPDPVVVDDELTLAFTVTNKGPSQANNAQLEVKLPAAASYALIAAKVGDGSDCAIENSTLRCSLGRLAVNDKAQVNIKLQAHEAGTFSTTANAQSTVQEVDASNNSLVTATRVSQPLALSQGAVYVNGTEGMTGLQSLFDLVLSSDGKFLYASNFNQGGIAVLQREASTGALSFVQFLSKSDAGVTGLGGAAQLALSSDGAWLYAVGFSDDHLVVLQRDSNTGKLTFAQAVDGADVGLQALQGPFAVITRDNFIYVADFNADALLVLQQRLGTSDLVGVQTVSGEDGLNGINYLALSADGTQLYATSSLDNSLVVFTRNGSTGKLTQSQVLRNQTDTGGITGLNGASAVLATPDNQHVYVAGGAASSIVVLQRNASGQLQYLQTHSDTGSLSSVADLTLSVDGKYLYAAATNSNALTILSRNASTGLLSLQSSLVQGANGVQGLSGVRAVAVSPDAQQVYTASLNGNAISMFRLPSADLEVSLTASAATLTRGQEVTYNVLIKNLGTDRATTTLLNVQIPTGLTVQNIESTGVCEQTQGNIQCRLGTINAGSAKKLSVKLMAETAGNFAPSASVSAAQNDANPNNNSASLALGVTGVANLVVGMQATPPFSTVGAEILYTINLINAGPDAASQIVLRDTLPAQLSFVSATLAGQACEFTNNIITCRLASLAVQGSVSGEIRATVLESVVIHNTVDVSSDSLDLSLPNQSVATLSPVSRVINTEIDNSGKVLSNVLITATGVVNGGTVAGIVENQGRLNNVTLAADAKVTGSGGLSGIINNAGEIQTAQLLANAQLNGGRVTGVLQGGASLVADLLPRISNVRIEAGAEVRNVLIDDTVVLDDLAILGVGVKFSRADLLPIGKNISGLFAILQENYTQGKALNLDFSPTLNSQDNVLQGLNNSPDMYGLTFTQNAWGHLFFALDVFIVNATPVQVIRREAAAATRLTITPEGSAVFVSTNQFEVLLQPALRKPEALNTVLQAFALQAYSQADGNIEIPLPANSGRLLVRPDWFSAPADVSLDQSGSPAALGFQAIASQPTVSYALLFFDDSLGVRRQQLLYPAVADRGAWFNNTGLSALNLSANGLVSFTQNGKTYQGVFDYAILPGGVGSGNAVSIANTNDQNADKIADLLVTYPNGEQQKVFLSQ